jgi:hypothetical protein
MRSGAGENRRCETLDARHQIEINPSEVLTCCWLGPVLTGPNERPCDEGNGNHEPQQHPSNY